MPRARRKLRFNQTPPIELWRTYPLWEYCIDEEGVPGQDEGTLRPSDAPNWNLRFDHSAPCGDLAFVCGEATLADGTRLPTLLSFYGAPIVGKDAGPEILQIYVAPPRVDDGSYWTLRFERIVGRWVVPPRGQADDDLVRGRYPSFTKPFFDLENSALFPLQVTTFAPRYKGPRTYTLTIQPDGISTEASR